MQGEEPGCEVRPQPAQKRWSCPAFALSHLSAQNWWHSSFGSASFCLCTVMGFVLWRPLPGVTTDGRRCEITCVWPAGRRAGGARQAYCRQQGYGTDTWGSQPPVGSLLLS